MYQDPYTGWQYKVNAHPTFKPLLAPITMVIGDSPRSGIKSGQAFTSPSNREVLPNTIPVQTYKSLIEKFGQPTPDLSRNRYGVAAPYTPWPEQDLLPPGYKDFWGWYLKFYYGKRTPYDALMVRRWTDLVKAYLQFIDRNTTEVTRLDFTTHPEHKQVLWELGWDPRVTLDLRVPPDFTPVDQVLYP